MNAFTDPSKQTSIFSIPLNAGTSGSNTSSNPLNPLSNPLNPNPTSNLFNPTPNPLNPTPNPLNPNSNPLNPSSSNLFNPLTSNTQTGSNPLFGKPAPSLFGGTQGTGNGTSTNALASASSAAPASGGLFGNRPSSATSTGGLFGGGSSSADAAKPTGSLFGGDSATAPPTNSLFGNTASAPGAGSIFGGQTSTTPKPTEGGASTAPKSNLFGNTTTSTAPGPSGTLTGGLFGQPTKPAEGSAAAAPPSTTQPPAGTSSASTGASAGGSSIFSSGSSLFGKPAASNTMTAPATTSSGTTTLPAGGLFGLKPADKKDAPAPTAPGMTSLVAAKPEDKSIAAPAMNLPTVAVPPPSALKGKTLEEIVNRWSSDLETHAREFNRYAAEVAVWDRALIENGNTLSALYSHITAAERQQDNIDQSLSHIEQQQKDLAATLDAYETMSQELLGGQSGSLRTLDTGPADTERDKNYMLATDLHTQLDDLSGSLTQMIDAVNGLSVSNKPNGESSDDPMSQISQVLSSHLESLQWIDGAVREVEGKVSDIEKRVKDSGYNLTGGPNQGKSRGFGLHR